MSISGKGANMVLEDIKKWRNYQYVNMESMKTIHNIDWLIAELERTRARESTANMLVELTQEETANRCAWLAGQTSKVAEHKIRLEFN
jgi:hypothetical protein